MPLYAFLCDCGARKDVLAGMEEITSLSVTCDACGARMGQDYQRKRHQVLGDELRKPLPCHTLKSVRNPDNPGAVDVVHTRSELKQVVNEHNRMYGTKLEHVG